eukprot:NODE_23554_length_661_cov_2.794007.p2 GENE.NODE_23554_length_661_cov_2.794007~~NODE_23554_length_661_cov_2.794007.p2  ORF type:complete len:64 (+),score=11.95 NODE_23554_length_661_cov_2.794007:211-402(+)
MEGKPRGMSASPYAAVGAMTLEGSETTNCAMSSRVLVRSLVQGKSMASPTSAGHALTTTREPT